MSASALVFVVALVCTAARPGSSIKGAIPYTTLAVRNYGINQLFQKQAARATFQASPQPEEWGPADRLWRQRSTCREQGFTTIIFPLSSSEAMQTYAEVSKLSNFRPRGASKHGPCRIFSVVRLILTTDSGCFSSMTQAYERGGQLSSSPAGRQAIVRCKFP